MADFKDTFNRANSANPGNNWKFKAKAEGDPAQIWRVVNNKAAPHTDPDISTIMYRANPVGVGATYKVTWKHRGMIGVENAELVFRYTATGGRGNKRYAIVIVGTSGTLRERWWNGVAQVETTVGSWVRAGGNEWDVTVYVSGDDIAIYDTAFAGIDNLALELTSSYQKYDTGIGMASGVIDEFEIDDIDQMASADFDCSPARVRVSTDLMAELKDPDAFTGAPQPYAGIEIGPYVVLKGIPQAAGGSVRLPVDLVLGPVTTEDTGLLLDPTAMVVGSDQRWLPTPYPTGGEWVPYVDNASGITWVFPEDPERDPDYTYGSAVGLVTREAVCFNGDRYMQLAGMDPLQDEWTMAITGVFRSGQGPKYAVIRTDQTDSVPESPLGLVYEHGLVSVDAAGRQLSYETQKLSGQPAVLMISVKKDINMGRVLVQDHARTLREFALSGVDATAGVFMGAYMNVLDEFTSDSAGVFDVLEINRWDRQLEVREMLQHVTKMSACYGVS